jgi:hypothetical protein
MKRLTSFLGLIGLAVSLIFCLAPATAHNKSTSFSDWLWQDDTLQLSFTIAMRTATILPDVAVAASVQDAVAVHLLAHIEVRQNGKTCPRTQGYQTAPAKANYIKLQTRFQCFDAEAPITLRNHAFFNLARSHVHFARLRLASQGLQDSEELLFTASQRQHQISRSPSGSLVGQTSFGDAMSQYVGLGVAHILTGIDHLAFVLCLLLLSQTRRHALVLVTGFTLGHSLTLGLAALGFVAPNAAFVEAIIGGSIALIAAEHVLARQGAMPRAGCIAACVLLIMAGLDWLRGGEIAFTGWLGLIVFCACYGASIKTPADAKRLAPIVTFGFGLFHGFGFSGLLAEVGLPQDQLLAGLLGFNLGVEIGQIIFLTPILLLAPYLARRLPVFKLSWSDAVASGLAGFGVYLFVQRTLFL